MSLRTLLFSLVIIAGALGCRRGQDASQPGGAGNARPMEGTDGGTRTDAGATGTTTDADADAANGMASDAGVDDSDGGSWDGGTDGGTYGGGSRGHRGRSSGGPNGR
jgi:hypothetical protein